MIRALFAFAQFELELFMTAFIAVFFTYAVPCSIFAFNLRSVTGDPGVAAANILPITIGVTIVFTSFYTLANQVAGYREAGFYKRILVTKINSVGLALSNAIRGYAVIFIGLIIMIAESLIFFRVLPKVNFLESILAILVAGGGMFLIALVPVCFIRKSASMFTLASVFSYILLFTSGAQPVTGKWTGALHVVSLFSPSYYALNVLKAGFNGTLFSVDALLSCAVLLVCAAASLIIVRKKLKWF